jgi:hypothetical protein
LSRRAVERFGRALELGMIIAGQRGIVDQIGDYPEGLRVNGAGFVRNLTTRRR